MYCRVDEWIRQTWIWQTRKSKCVLDNTSAACVQSNTIAVYQRLIIRTVRDLSLRPSRWINRLMTSRSTVDWCVLCVNIFLTSSSTVFYSTRVYGAVESRVAELSQSTVTKPLLSAVFDQVLILFQRDSRWRALSFCCHLSGEYTFKRTQKSWWKLSAKLTIFHDAAPKLSLGI